MMTVLWIYLVATVVVAFIWFLFVGLDEAKKHPVGVTVASLGIVMVVWPVLACAVIACLTLSMLSPLAPRVR